MNYNFRPKPKLIDPNFLGRVNKAYIGKQSENNFVLEWLFNKIVSYFKDNFFFSLVVVLLIGYLLYRYFETIKKKNRIKNNINEDKEISVKLDKPINYNEKFNNEDNISVISNISSPKNMVFEKDLERELQMGDNIQSLNNLPPEMIRQQIMQQQMQQGNFNQGFGMNSGPNIYSTGMPTALQQNTQNFRAPNESCGNFKTTSVYEPTALNAFSDNFENF